MKLHIDDLTEKIDKYSKRKKEDKHEMNVE